MRFSNIAWSLVGLALPLVVALLCIPLLLQSLGPERFGLLSLVWALTAVAGLFDLGIGRAATRVVAELIGNGELMVIRGVVAQAVRLTRRSGLLGAALAGIAVWAGATAFLKFSPELDREVRNSAYLLALMIPLQAGIATYRGICEGLMRFHGTSLVRVLLGVGNFGVPLAVALLSTDLTWIVASLVGVRLLAWLAYRHLAMSCLPAARSTNIGQPRSSLLAPSLWFTAGTIFSALLVQADRFFISTHLTVAQVPSYTVPLEIVLQLFIVVTAVSTVAYPALSERFAHDRAQAWYLFMRWLGRIALVMALVAISAALLLPQFMTMWIKTLLPPESTIIGLVLCIGLWTHSLGIMSMSMLHAAGKFKEAAIVNFIEIPFYYIALSILIERFGVTGAAIAWVGRVTIDAVLLYAVCWFTIRTPLSSRALRRGPVA